MKHHDWKVCQHDFQLEFLSPETEILAASPPVQLENNALIAFTGCG